MKSVLESKKLCTGGELPNNTEESRKTNVTYPVNFSKPVVVL